MEITEKVKKTDDGIWMLKNKMGKRKKDHSKTISKFININSNIRIIIQK